MTTGFTFETFGEEPIVLITYQEGWTMQESGKVAMNLVRAAFDASPVPLFYIVDGRIEPKINFQDLLTLTSELTQGGDPLLRHPNMREHLLVTTSAMMKLAAKGLSAEAFGGIKARCFDTLEEALDYARTQIRVTTTPSA